MAALSSQRFCALRDETDRSGAVSPHLFVVTPLRIFASNIHARIGMSPAASQEAAAIETRRSRAAQTMRLTRRLWPGGGRVSPMLRPPLPPRSHPPRTECDQGRQMHAARRGSPFGCPKWMPLQSQTQGKVADTREKRRQGERRRVEIRRAASSRREQQTKKQTQGPRQADEPAMRTDADAQVQTAEQQRQR